MNRFFFGSRAIAVTGLALTSLGGLSACNSTNGCTNISCFHTVTVTPVPTLSQSGTYEVDLDADGKTIRCTVDVPSTAPARCTDDAAYVAQEPGKGIVYFSVDST